jgi:NmrA-like family
VKELLAEGFHVTALTRESSNATFPDGVAVKKVDYSSLESLQSALLGQDAVVSVIGTFAIATQMLLVDAAQSSSVKRFIPSEFGINTRTLGDQKIGTMLAGKMKVVDYLQQKAREDPAFSWSAITTGMFFDAVSTLRLDRVTRADIR